MLPFTGGTVALAGPGAAGPPGPARASAGLVLATAGAWERRQREMRGCRGVRC